MELDYENIEVVAKLASYFKDWTEENKYYGFKFNVMSARRYQSSDIIVIHNLWRENGVNYNIDNGETFLYQIAYLLNDWIESRDYNDDDFKYLNDFWITKIPKLNG